MQLPLAHLPHSLQSETLHGDINQVYNCEYKIIRALTLYLAEILRDLAKPLMVLLDSYGGVEMVSRQN